jgi:hypothetical protein
MRLSEHPEGRMLAPVVSVRSLNVYKSLLFTIGDRSLT